MNFSESWWDIIFGTIQKKVPMWTRWWKLMEEDKKRKRAYQSSEDTEDKRRRLLNTFSTPAICDFELAQKPSSFFDRCTRHCLWAFVLIFSQHNVVSKERISYRLVNKLGVLCALRTLGCWLRRAERTTWMNASEPLVCTGSCLCSCSSWSVWSQTAEEMYFCSKLASWPVLSIPLFAALFGLSPFLALLKASS